MKSRTNKGAKLISKGFMLIFTLSIAVIALMPLAVSAADGDLAIDENNFPDANFREIITEYFDKNNDGLLSSEEIADATALGVYKKNISDLTGVEHFTSLKYIHCFDNQITHLDLSKNTQLDTLSCYNNKLTSLDVSNNTELKYLYCGGNQITTLDLSKNTALEELDCDNNQLTHLDLSKQSPLNRFYGQDQSRSITIDHATLTFTMPEGFDASKATDVKNGSFSGNVLTVDEGASTVSYTYATGLTDTSLSVTLTITNPHTHSYDATHTCTCGVMKHSFDSMTGVCSCGAVEFGNKAFPDENFRGYILKEKIGAEDGILTVAELRAVTILFATHSNISDLKGIEHFTELKNLSCYNNQLTYLDVSKNVKLTILSCSNNLINGLDLSKNTELTQLSCESNFLTSLDLTNNLKIISLHCGSNQLTSLDISKNTRLVYLTCQNNQLTSISVNHIPNLYEFCCGNNPLKSIDVRDNSRLYEFNCENTQLTSIDVSKNTALVRLYCGKNKLTTIDVSKNTALGLLNCNNNQLTTLDIKNNLELYSLNFEVNYIASIDVTKHVKLTYFTCGNNQITTLDVSNNTELYSLSCDNNLLTTLDVSNNIGLVYFYCQNNRLTSINMSSHEKIYDFSGGGQKISITIDQATMSYTMPEGFDSTKITSATNCSFNGNVLTVNEGATTCSYIYATGCKQRVIGVSLTLTNPHKHSYDDHTCKCTCGASLLNFEYFNISLGEDIRINYYVTKNDKALPQVRFTVNGYTRTVDGTLNGEWYKFSFDGVAPQWIKDSFTAELIVNGTVIDTKTYSVLEYLNELKGSSAAELGYSDNKYSAMTTLINELLLYSGAAQTYTGYHTDDLVSDGITGTAFVPLTTTDKSVTQGSAVNFAGVTVYYNGTNHLRFYFTAADTEGLVFKLKVGDGEEAEIVYTAASERYLVETDAISAASFDVVYTLTAYKNGVADATFIYSIRSYVYAMQNGNGAMADLAKATYNYCLAAKDFAAA